jgi:acetyl esterase/lipase
MSRLSPQEMRERFARFIHLVGGGASAIGSVEAGELPGSGGPLPIRTYTPLGHEHSQRPGWIYFHGGGGVFGDLDTHDGLCRALASASGCRLISVGYRLAPEHRFPAAADDSWAAVRWVFANAATLKLDAKRIAVGGDSAGGGLAAAVCQRAGREGGAAIALQVLLCPALDMAAESDSRRALAAGYFLDKATIDWTVAHYCPPDVDPADPRLSPLYAADLAGQPPALVHTAEFDPLRDEGRAYADKLASAGVDARYTCHAGMIHHFYGMAGAIPYARTAVAAIGAAVGAALA